MFSRILEKEIQEDSLAPGYFFFGEESYLAERFVRELQSLLIPPDAEDFRIDIFHLDETKWADILDTARTMPFLFSPWRILTVRIPEAKPSADRAAEKEEKLVSPVEQKLLKAYFAAPSSRTVMTVILPGPVKRNHPVVRLFSSLPGVVAKEVKPLRDAQAKAWLEEKARSLGKALAPQAGWRILEIVGTDLRRMDNEIEKLAVYVDERKTIDVADVNQVTAWDRDFNEFELDNGLESADFQRCLAVLDNLIKMGEKPERILSRIVGFFRKILVAKAYLAEKSRTKQEIFKEFFPYISENFRSLYQEKYTAFFAMVEGLSRSDLGRILDELATVDLWIKTTEVLPQTAFEGFLFEYCRIRKKISATSRARD